MNIKNTLKIVLLVFIAISAVYLTAQSFQKKTTSEPCKDIETMSSQELAAAGTDAQDQTVQDEIPSIKKEASPPAEKNKATYVVYYFLTNVRCPTCMKLETYTKETVDRDFKKEIGTGEMIWSPVNLDTPENRHFIQDFQLAFKTVVIARVGEGNKVEKWKNLDKVWEVVGDKEMFMSYISNEIKEFRGNL